MLQKSNTFKVLEVFFNEPTKKHYLLEISRNIKLAHTSVKRILNELEKEGLIKKTIEKKATRKFPEFSANYSEKIYKDYKKEFNIQKLRESKLIDFLEEKTTPNCIVLFGSYSRGEDFEDSDVDLYVQAKEQTLKLKNFEEILGKEIQIHINSEFTKFPNELKNSIINGIIISGYLEAYDNERSAKSRKSNIAQTHGKKESGKIRRN